jgi:hypothetical protein
MEMAAAGLRQADWRLLLAGCPIGYGYKMLHIDSCRKGVAGCCDRLALQWCGRWAYC